MIDLHTHTTASDGKMTPTELIQYAKQKGIDVLAITDHDTDAGISEAKIVAKAENVIFVPGIELNINWPTGEFHLLGLGIQETSPLLKTQIEFLQNGRHERNSQIVEKMRNDGLAVSVYELEKKYGNCLGRPHLAEWMVEHGVVKNRQQAFDKFLAKNRPYYVARQGLELEDAIKGIKSSGAIPVLAHPLSLYVSWGKMDGVLTELKERGIEGLEAFHPAARLSEAERLEECAHRFGFLVTAGSDFHGEGIRADRKIGKSAGLLKIEDRFWLNELRPAMIKAGWSEKLI